MGSVETQQDVALVYPPVWYYTSVPADLTYTGAFLRSHEVSTSIWDLSAGLSESLFGELSGWGALQQRETYQDLGAHQAAVSEIHRAAANISKQHRVRYRLRSLRFPGLDEANVAGALKLGLAPGRNPALRTLKESAARILATGPKLIAIALVYPQQRVQALTLARVLRTQGYRGWLVLYGALQDEIAPEDFAQDLVSDPRHLIFRDFDGVIVGEAETALWELVEHLQGQRTLDGVSNLLSPKLGELVVPQRRMEDLSTHPAPDFSHIRGASYCTPSPVVDLRLGRGCPWGKCAFCAIQAHHPGYRATSIQNLMDAMTAAHTQLGASFFRIRDDLVTPDQLSAISQAVATLSFQPRWTARMRFQRAITPELLAMAKASGLEELWLGLESATPNVRQSMVKGVAQSVVLQNLDDLCAAGIRTRALCMIGFPGETLAEATETVEFLLPRLSPSFTASLSPFELMRRSPMALDPKKWNLRFKPDPLPAFARLRYRQLADWPGRLERADMEQLLRRIQEKLIPFLRQELMPDAAHGWIRASVAAKGWPT